MKKCVYRSVTDLYKKKTLSYQALTSKQRQAGMSALMLVTMIAALSMGAIKVMNIKVNNAQKEQRFALNQMHLQQACTQALEQTSQLLGSAILNIDKSNRFVANSQLPANIKSSLLSGASKDRNWHFDNTGALYVRTCLELNLSEKELDEQFQDQNKSFSLDSCASEKQISASIRVEKVQDPTVNSQFARLVWKTAIVNASCSLGEQAQNAAGIAMAAGAGQLQFSARARINFLPPSQMCDYESEDNSEYCNVDHCKFMSPLMVSDHQSKASKGDVYLKQEEAGKRPGYSLVPNPNYKAPLYLPVPKKIPQVAAYLHVEDSIQKDPPKDLIDFVKDAVCPGSNDPFLGWQGVEGGYHITDYFDESQRDKYDRIRFQVPAYNRIGQIAIVDEGAAVAHAQEAALEFEGYLYHGSSNGWNDHGGSIQSNWRLDVQQSNPSLHAALLKGGCKRTVGIEDADFCTRIKLTHAYFDYSYPKKRLCRYEGPSEITKDEYKSLLHLLAGKTGSSVDTKSLRDWQQNSAYLQATSWQLSSATEEGFFNYSLQKPITPFKDESLYWHHEFNPLKSISDPLAKVPHAFTGIIESVIKAKQVRQHQLTMAYPACPAPVAAAAEPVSGSDGPQAQRALAEGDEAPLPAQLPCPGAKGVIVTDATPAAELVGKLVKEEAVLMERFTTLTWKAACEVVETAPLESIPIQKQNKGCAKSSLPLSPAAEQKFDKCYYVAYYNSTDRHNCVMDTPPPGHAFECRNHNGCFAKGTPIKMADGGYRPIEQLRSGDFVHNPMTVGASRVVSVIVGPQQKEMYRLQLASGKQLEATSNHPFVTEQGFKRAEELRIGERILLDDMSFASLQALEKVPVDDGTLVWNLTLEEDELSLYWAGPLKQHQSLKNHMFIANGVVTGDYYIQNLQDLSEESQALMLSDKKQNLYLLDGEAAASQDGK